MSLHDAYARLTPFEVAFPDGAAFESLVEEVEAEASGRGLDASDPQAFHTLGAAARAVSRLHSPEQAPDTTHRFIALLFHSTHFFRAGRPVYLIETSVTRRLVVGASTASPDPPSPAGYAQLPQHLFWVDDPKGGVPESLDGAFWTATESGMLHVLLITGLRPDRPGFGVFPLPEAPLAHAADWLDAVVREGEDDYASSMEGSDVDGLYSVTAAGEALKLLARFFAYTSATPGTLEEAEPGDVEPLGPPPSALPYARVRLVA